MSHPTAERQLSGLDHLLVAADRALRTLTGDTRPALRASPALQAAECSLTKDEIARSIGLMRVNKDAQTNVSIQCTKALPYTVKFFDAADAAATTFAMKDAGAVNDIAFSLYQDGSRTIAWDSVNGKTGTGNAGATATNVVLYGRIPPQAAAPEGHYVAQMRAQIDF